MPGILKWDDGPGPKGPPMWLPIPREPGPRIRALKPRYHGPGQYCFYCPCYDCHMHFEVGIHRRVVDADTLEVTRPKYSYMGLVNSLRDASYKREEDRQDKLRAEREASAAAAAAAAAVKAPKKDKASKDQAKNN